MIHPLSDVQSIHIGSNTSIWQFAIILKNAIIGDNCNINCHTFIENDVKIGNNVTVKSGVYLWDGIEIEDNVFIGPNVTFTNDQYPRSKILPEKFQRTIIKKGASIGANSTILGGSTIGSYALIGAGSLVNNDIPDNAIAFGSPATVKGWVDESGRKLSWTNDYFVSESGQRFIIENNKLVKL